jgi:putative ABC transport system permease protein
MLRHNLIVALRGFASRPGFALAAILALALGTGANSAIFSIINTSLIRPLPFRDIDHLVAIWQTSPGEARVNFSAREYKDWETDLGVFEQIGGWTGNGFTLTGRGEPETLLGQLVTSGFFQVLGTHPILGRTFRPEEGEPGKDTVIVLSHAWWQERFAGDKSILGQSLALNGAMYTVIGIMPPDFDYPARDYRFWVPATIRGGLFARYQDAHFLRIVGKLKPGITAERLRADLDTLTRRVSTERVARKVLAAPLREDIVGSFRTPLLLLLAAGGVVLLIACANVANLLLGRAAGRSREMAVRAALGAGRADLIGQLLTESILLSLAGGGAGLLLGSGMLEAFQKLSPRGLPWIAKAHFDPAVLWFTIAIAVLTGVLFGLAPALAGSRTNLNAVIQQGSRGTAGRASGALRNTLVFAETALCAMLLIGAGLLVRSLLTLERVNPGFRPAQVVTASIGMQTDRYPTATDQLRFYRAALEGIAALPGVEAAGITTHLPFSGQGWGNGFEIEGRTPPPGHSFVTQVRAISPGYFRALGVPLVSGRDLTDRDNQGSPGVALINQALARQYWPTEDPVGKRIRIDQGWLTIAGVVGDIHHFDLDSSPDAEIFLCYPQLSSGLKDLVGRGLALAIRTPLDVGTVGAELRTAVRAIDREMPVRVLPMNALISGSVAQPRFRTLVIALFAVLAVILACIGIYGVVSYSVAQRVQEIGIRMALGARPADVFGMVWTRTLALVVPAAATGVLGAWLFSRVLSGLLFGVTRTDTLTYVAAPLTLIAVALAAAFVPARRAAAVDPIEALRDS